MLRGIEQLDKRIGIAVWRFIQRNGRASVRRLLMFTVLFIAAIIAPSVLLLSWLMPGGVLGSEQASVIGLMFMFGPAVVLYGGLFAARAHGVMGRQRSILLAAIYTLVFLGCMIVASGRIDFGSQTMRVGYAIIATGLTAVAASAYARKCKTLPIANELCGDK